MAMNEDSYTDEQLKTIVDHPSYTEREKRLARQLLRPPAPYLMVHILRDYPGDAIVSMASHQGKLYAATAHGRIWLLDTGGY